jgi:hypothetical protein
MDTNTEGGLFVNESMFLNIHRADSSFYECSSEFRTKNNIEALSYINSWLLDTHSALSCEYGFLKAKDDDGLNKRINTLINKINLLSNIISEQVKLDLSLVNLKLFRSKVHIESLDCLDKLITLEVIFNESVRKPILINCELIGSDDKFSHWKFLDLSSVEIELFEKMIFLLHRNQTSYNK